MVVFQTIFEFYQFHYLRFQLSDIRCHEQFNIALYIMNNVING